MSRNVFKPLKKQFYLSKKLDFQESSPKKQQQEDEEFNVNKRSTIIQEIDTKSEFQMMRKQKQSLQPLYNNSTKEQTGFSFRYQQEMNELDYIEQGPNIFKDIDNEERKKYTDYNIGPKYDQEGNLIRWSILGKADQFSRVQNLKKKGVQIGLQQNSIKQMKTPHNQASKEALSKNMSIREIPEDQGKILKTQMTNQSSLNHQHSVSGDNIRLQTATSSKISAKKGQSKKHRSEFKLVPKQDLLNYMLTVQDRVKQNEQLDDSFNNNLAINMRNIVTREERVLQKFDQQLEDWSSQRIQISANCSRQVQDALVSRTEGYRKRVENIQGVECTKSDNEKYSNRYWYLHLRGYQEHNSISKTIGSDSRRAQFDLTSSIKHKDIQRVESRVQNRFVHDREAEQLFKTQEFIVADIFSGFQTKVVDNPNMQIEIVRKPLLAKDQSAPLFSDKFHRLFEQRIKENPKGLNGKQAKLDELESDLLVMEGKSVYYKELQNLQNDGGPLMAFYQKHDIDKDIGDDQKSIINQLIKKEVKLKVDDEIIAEQWNTRILSKTGEHFYPQLIKVKK